MQVFNLADGRQIVFSAGVSALHAVCYAYCDEQKMLSAFFSAVQRNELDLFSKKLPITRGEISIACGDWSALT